MCFWYLGWPLCRQECHWPIDHVDRDQVFKAPMRSFMDNFPADSPSTDWKAKFGATLWTFRLTASHDRNHILQRPVSNYIQDRCQNIHEQPVQFNFFEQRILLFVQQWEKRVDVCWSRRGFEKVCYIQRIQRVIQHKCNWEEQHQGFREKRLFECVQTERKSIDWFHDRRRNARTWQDSSH